MPFVCVSDGHVARVYSESVDAEDAAVSYAQHCDDRMGEGPTERVVFVRDAHDPDAEVIAVAIEYEMEPVYYAAECDAEASAAVIAALDEGADDAA